MSANNEKSLNCKTVKEIKVQVIAQNGNANANPLCGNVVLESSYRLISIERLLIATEKSIIAMIEKVEARKIEWLETRISDMICGKTLADSFYIGDHYYNFSVEEK